MCNNFLSFLQSLQLLIILQQLEFSYILKELQVLVYFSLPTLLLISKPFVIVIGGTYSDSRQSVTGFSVYLEILSYPGNQRSNEQYQRVLMKLNTGNDHCYMWNSMANLPSSRFQISFWATISFILWQWLSKIHCSKSSVLRAYKTYRNRLSCC